MAAMATLSAGPGLDDNDSLDDNDEEAFANSNTASCGAKAAPIDVPLEVPSFLLKFLRVDAEAYELSAATTTIFENIHGMAVSRDKCEHVAKTELGKQLMGNESLASFGAPPVQPAPGPNIQSLLSQADKVRGILEESVRDGLLEYGMSPASIVTTTVLGKTTNTKQYPCFTVAPLKEESSCHRKVRNDYKGDHSRLCDIARCSVVVGTEDELSLLLKAFVENKFNGISVVRLKNRFASPMFTGIRDCLMNVEITCADDTACGSDGAKKRATKHVGEIQLHYANILALKGECHAYYEFFREFFSGTNESYHRRLKMFEKLGEINEGESIEDKVRTILSGEDKEKLKAMVEIAGLGALGDPGLELAACKRLAAIALREMGENSEEFLGLLFNVAESYRLKGKYDRAKEAFEICWEGRKKLHGESDWVTLLALMKIGKIHHVKGEYDEALAMYEKVYEGQKSQLGTRAPSTLLTLAGMVNIYKQKEEYDKALALCEEVYEGFESAYGVEDPLFTLATLNNMALIYKRMGNHDRALELCERAYEGQKRSLGSEHRTPLLTLNNIALVWYEKGNFAKAAELYSVCFEGRKAAQGNDHPDTLKSLKGMNDAREKMCVSK
jgi:tetratricopeptide (TPR) repeat protein